MINRSVLSLVLVGALTSSHLIAGDKDAHVRAWIGGEFALAKQAGFFQKRGDVHAFPGELRSKQKAGIFARLVPTDSPAARAGLKTGDLILQVNEQPVESLSRFHALLDPIPPGQSVALTAWRRGEELNLTVTAGRETYHRTRTLGFGFFWSGQLDLWPNPDFSLFVLGFKRGSERMELHSPESEYVRFVREFDGGRQEAGRDSHEGAKLWLTPFHFGSHKRILTQEPMEASIDPQNDSAKKLGLVPETPFYGGARRPRQAEHYNCQ